MFDERQVVARILGGDFRAFELLVKQYKRLVFFIINRLVHEKEDQEDICQEVFIKVHRSLPGFAFGSRLSTWIARIAYLTAVNHLKKNQRFRKTDYPDDLDHFHFTNENPEEILTHKDLGQYLEELLSQMPEKYRITLTLYHLEDFSCAEISAITGIPETTVKTYLFRGRKLLKQRIEVYLKTYTDERTKR